MIIFRPARREEVLEIAPRLRPEDVREVRTLTGRLPEEVLMRDFGRRGCEYYTGRAAPDAPPCVIFGVRPDLVWTSAGVVWLLATPEAGASARAIMRESRAWLDAWAERFSLLHNIVDLRNIKHVRWIELMDFKLGPTTLRDGHEFMYFSMGEHEFASETSLMKENR